MFFSVVLLSYDAVEPKHDVAPCFVVVLNPIIDIINVDGSLGLVVLERDDVTSVGSFGSNLNLRINPIRKRVYDGVAPLSLREEVVLHSWAPSHVVGSVEDGNKACELVGRLIFCVMRSAYVRAKYDNRMAEQHKGDPLGRRGKFVSGQWRASTLCLPCRKTGFYRR